MTKFFMTFVKEKLFIEKITLKKQSWEILLDQFWGLHNRKLL